MTADLKGRYVELKSNVARLDGRVFAAGSIFVVIGIVKSKKDERFDKLTVASNVGDEQVYIRDLHRDRVQLLPAEWAPAARKETG